jgi:hypothetical protein
MSKQDDETRLPERFEAILRDWPVPERDQSAWDESADTIMTRMAMARRAPDLDKLVEPPLPREDGESAYPPPSVSGRPAAPIATDEVDGGWGERDSQATIRVEPRPSDLEEDTLSEETLTRKIKPEIMKAQAAAMMKPAEPPRIKTPEPMPAVAVEKPEPPRIKTPAAMPAVRAPEPVVEKAPEPIIDEVLAHATVSVATPPEPPAAPVAARPSPVPAIPPQPESAPRSLLDLAKQSIAHEEAAKESSDIARASFSLASKSRAAAPELAQTQPAMAVVSPPAPPPPAPELVAPAANVIPMSTRPPAKRSSAGAWAFVGITLIGLAAGAFIFITRAQRSSESLVAQTPPAAAPAAATNAPAAEQAKPSANDPEAIALKDLPATAEAAPSAPHPASKGGTAEKLAPPPTSAEAKGEKTPPPATPEKEKDEEGAKMKPALMPTDLPDHPSSGAVQAAIGSVLGNARACVAGQDLYSQAIVTFAADGSVQGVKVTGGAAGKPAEACIQAALMKARVQPFSRPTFAVSATIRP